MLFNKKQSHYIICQTSFPLLFYHKNSPVFFLFLAPEFNFFYFSNPISHFPKSLHSFNQNHLLFHPQISEPNSPFKQPLNRPASSKKNDPELSLPPFVIDDPISIGSSGKLGRIQFSVSYDFRVSDILRVWFLRWIPVNVAILLFKTPHPSIVTHYFEH